MIFSAGNPHRGFPSLRTAVHLLWRASPMIKQVKFVSIPVKDQERALAFYRDKLGFEVTTDAPMGEGGRWIEMRPPGAQTRIVLFTPQGQEDRIGTFSGVSLECDDIDATYAE